MQVVALSASAPAALKAGAGTTWYFNGEDNQGLSYEKEVKTNGITEYKHYLSAGGMVFALQVSRVPNVVGGTLAAGAPSVPGSTQSASLRYLHHDHLGSVAAITDGTTGQVIERLAFDPWGKRRNINGQADTTDSLVGLTTDRGYTEHEHLDEMGLIHMNGRVYDPLVGRMMSADPSIPRPYDLRSFNRYAYVYNNPLKLVDPSGFEPWGSSDGGSTQYTNTGNGTVSNTYTGNTYSLNPGTSSGSYGSAVSATNVAGPKGQGAAPIATYSPSTGNWQVTSYGRTLASENRYNFQIQLAVAAADQNKPYRTWEGPSRTWVMKHMEASAWDAFKGAVVQFISSLGLPGGAAVTKAEGYVAREVTAAEEIVKGLPDAALVCRGGACKAENFINGTGVTRAADGTLSGVSTQSAAVESLNVLAQPFKNNQVGVTTVGEIRAIGGRVKADGHLGNPNHATVDGLTGPQLESLFSPTVRNPVSPTLRGR